MKPFEFKQEVEESRSKDKKPVIIIFCEDDAVERAYFDRFRNGDAFQLTVKGNWGQHHPHVDNVIEFFREKNQLENVDGVEKVKFDDGTEVWSVFDRDKNANDQKDTAFSTSIQTAQTAGIKVAWSNDNFELWILLHFEDVPTNDATYHHRDKYYERLTAILKNVIPKNASLEKITQSPTFGYENHMKGKTRFLGITFQHMKGNLPKAIERAEALVTFHNSILVKPPHQQMPCTLVHVLVQRLIHLGAPSY